MGMTCGYGPARDRDAMISLIHRAVDLGVNFFDTAECYGPFANEELLGEALQPIRHNVFVATKFGLKSIGGRPVPDSRPESIRQSVEDSLRRLRTDHVDLLFQHRVDPRVPIEEVAETVGQLVQEGKVCHWGLSEASLNTIRRAHHILPLTAVENEYSPLWRDAERGLLALLDELGIGLVASSPIGKGLLSGQLSADMLFGKEDFRSTQPRFQPKHLAANYALILSPVYYVRSFYAVLAFWVIAIGSALTGLAQHQPALGKLPQGLLSGGLCVLLCFDLVEGGYDILNYSIMRQVREDTILTQVAEGEKDIETYAIYPYTRFCGAYGQPDLRLDKDNWVNVNMALHLGADSLVVTEQHYYPFPGYDDFSNTVETELSYALE